MYSYSTIQQLHIELTSLCNAACPGCARNFKGGETLPWLPLKQISWEDFQKFFPIKFLGQLRRITFCGSYGDPIMAKDLLAICRYLKTLLPDLAVQVHTNGGARSAEWWQELAQHLGKNSKVVFSIDGLKDTNHLYRRGVVWEKLWANVVAFISAGGHAEWDFLIFKHNEQQLSEARLLAQSTGFKNFAAKKAMGFESLNGLEMMTVLNEKGNYEGTLYPPGETSPSLDEERAFQEVWQKKRPARKPSELYTRDSLDWQNLSISLSQEKSVNECAITCHAQKFSEVYISSEGLVFPCCFVGSQFYLPNKGNVEYQQIQSLYDELGREQHSLYQRTLEAILADDFLQKKFVENWQKPSLLEGKLSVCSTYCGGESNKLETITYNRSAGH